MKIRQGFVSNSSSSSFLCNVCGEMSSGWDMGLEEAGMYECTDGHTFCEGHIDELTVENYISIGMEQIKKDMKQNKDEIKHYQDLVDAGLGSEKEQKYSSYTNQGYVEYYTKRLEENKKELDELIAFDPTDENFEEYELREFVEENIFGGDFRYCFPKEFCPVCQDLAKEQKQREDNASDPDWVTYIELYKKFNGIDPKVGK